MKRRWWYRSITLNHHREPAKWKWVASFDAIVWAFVTVWCDGISHGSSSSSSGCCEQRRRRRFGSVNVTNYGRAVAGRIVRCRSTHPPTAPPDDIIVGCRSRIDPAPLNTGHLLPLHAGRHASSPPCGATSRHFKSDVLEPDCSSIPTFNFIIFIILFAHKIQS